MKKNLYQRIEEYCSLNNLPDHDLLFYLSEKASTILENEPKIFRPWSKKGEPGGLLDFTSYKKRLPLIIVPDIHARTYFIKNILDFVPPNGFFKPEFENSTIYEALQKKICRVVCVGDALHSEMRGITRWKAAYEEFLKENYTDKNMLEEMNENMNLLCILMELKCEFSKNFHFLKGNHENIMNVYSSGDYPFRKFAQEGEMVKDFIQTYYGDDILMMISYWENSLPLVAAFPNCVISHAEPEKYFKRQQIINGRFSEEVVSALTWTQNGKAQNGSVEKMLKELTKNPDFDETFYFAGHRPVSENYSLRQNGKFIQIHNPERQNIALVYTDKKFNPETDIVSVEKNI